MKVMRTEKPVKASCQDCTRHEKRARDTTHDIVDAILFGGSVAKAGKGKTAGK
jgi:hypothetical protein